METLPFYLNTPCHIYSVSTALLHSFFIIPSCDNESSALILVCITSVLIVSIVSSSPHRDCRRGSDGGNSQLAPIVDLISLSNLIWLSIKNKI